MKLRLYSNTATNSVVTERVTIVRINANATIITMKMIEFASPCNSIGMNLYNCWYINPNRSVTRTRKMMHTIEDRIVCMNVPLILAVLSFDDFLKYAITANTNNRNEMIENTGEKKVGKGFFVRYNIMELSTNENCIRKAARNKYSNLPFLLKNTLPKSVFFSCPGSPY